jgi:hypothetical protein
VMEKWRILVSNWPLLRRSMQAMNWKRWRSSITAESKPECGGILCQNLIPRRQIKNEERICENHHIHGKSIETKKSIYLTCVLITHSLSVYKCHCERGDRLCDYSSLSSEKHSSMSSTLVNGGFGMPNSKD